MMALEWVMDVVRRFKRGKGDEVVKVLREMGSEVRGSDGFGSERIGIEGVGSDKEGVRLLVVEI